MFRRKKNDGFEWHNYVRTTIKLRREDRRRRIEELKDLAKDGLKGAGRAGLSSSASVVERISRVVMAPVGFVGGLIASVLAAAGSISVRPVAGASVLLARMSRPSRLVALTGQPGVAPLVILAALLTTLLGGARVYAQGTDAIAVAIIALAALLWGVVIWAGLPDGAMSGLRLPVGLPRLPGLSGMVERLPNVFAGLPPATYRLVAGIVVLGFAGWLGWIGIGLVGRALPTLGVASLTGTSRPPVEGRANAVSGDTLRIKDRTLRLAGIDAPEHQQTCGGRGRERRWRCGAVARTALQELVRNKTVRCDLSGRDSGGLDLASCRIGNKDVAAELVSGGHVFARAGFFASYARLEEVARSAGLGVWRGSAERPEAYRTRMWEAAKKAAPSGCPIKGHVARGERIYVVPWAPSYARTRVRESRGGRWFCNENEAVAAGWKPTDRS
jgi:endonuclease YncB( thermonuclease family)